MSDSSSESGEGGRSSVTGEKPLPHVDKDFPHTKAEQQYADDGERMVSWEPYGTMPLSKFNRRIWRNIIILSMAFMFNYISYSGLSNLQSSLHIDEGMGTICTSIRYVALVLSCIFVPRLMIRGMTHKWTIAVSFGGFIFWEAANGVGIWETMVPASIINGIFVAPLWAAQGAYFTELAREYASQNDKNVDNTIGLFFGIYYAFYTGSAVFGNLISSTVLSSSPPENYTAPSDEVIADMCGVEDCPWNTMNNTNLDKPPSSVVWTLVGIYIAICLSAILITCFLVDHLPRHLVHNSGLTVKEEFSTLILSTLKHTLKKKQLLLIPLTVYMGLEESYFGAEYNRSWVTCALGIWKIGLTNIPFGLAGAIVSFTGGRLVKLTGRIPIIIVGLVLDVGLQLFLATWTVDPNKEGVFYGVPTIWGTTDAIWVTLLGMTYGTFFPGESEAAFSNHMLWWCVGLAVGFGYSNALCADVKLYILFGLLWVGVASSFGAEYIHRKSTNVVSIEGTEGSAMEVGDVEMKDGKTAKDNLSFQHDNDRPSSSVAVDKI